MNLGELIVSALQPVGLPIEPNTFTESYDTYIVYTYDESPIYFADNQPQYIHFFIEIYLVAPAGKSTYQYREKIREQLIKHGFTYPEITGGAISYNTAAGQQCYVFICEYAIPEGVTHG